MTRYALLVTIALLIVTRTVFGGPIVINEIHFDPAVKVLPEEFIELHNQSDAEVDVSGWFFSSGIFFVIPPDTTIPANGFLVVAESPERMVDAFGVDALGPYDGRLSNSSDRIDLRSPDGNIQDSVDYQAAFPWPIASEGGGSSLELIHPSLDNDLAGSWRASGLVERPFRERVFLLESESTGWRYRKGTSEASDPIEAWRDLDFQLDETWLAGQTSIGFGDDDDNTVLDDMRENYTTVYLRHTFDVALQEDGSLPRLLKIGLYVDDGAFIWINGVDAQQYNTRTDPITYDTRARTGREARWQHLDIQNAHTLLREGENILSVLAMNSSITSADFSIDVELFVPGTEDEDPDALAPPTPGDRNSVYSETAPPQIRQVDHLPTQPTSSEPFVITAKVTDPDGVVSVNVELQEVRAGEYVPAYLPLPQNRLIGAPQTEREVNPEYVSPQSWTTIAMVDDGTGGDAVANDSIYTALLEPRDHRTLVRYKISATDAADLSVTVPYRDDPSLNFALFVSDGIPGYETTRLSVHPEGPGHVYPPEVMTSIPVYTLATRAEDMTHAVAYSGAFQIPKSNERARDKFNWNGTFIYDGRVYDHVTYRLRQANDRYGGSGKRSMRIRFRKGNYLRVRDQYGKRYPTRWRTLNTGKMFDNKRVGNFGLTETMNALLWNMVGTPAPWFHTFHFRVIDDTEEAPADNFGQYRGDFWGMFNAIQDYDPRFLSAHDLDDGNLYKLKDGQFNGNDLRRNQGRRAVTTDRDFQNIRSSLRPQRTDDWLNAHVNYPRWYPYHAVVEGIRHYDFRPADSHSKNRAWYFEPDYDGSEYGRLWTLPWDSDASWGPNWNSGVDYTKNAIFSGRGKPAFKQEYRNFIREFRDLVWTRGVIETMIDDLAAAVEQMSMADRDRWRNGPADAGRQDFGSMTAKVNDMKRFAFIGWSGASGPTVPAGGRARHLENLANAEGDRTRIPNTPTVTALAPEGFPADQLRFRSSPFTDPQDEDSFAGIVWRLGEISSPDRPFDPTRPRLYEYPALWEVQSDDFLEEIVVPRSIVEEGHLYRVRVKHRDNNNKWSHWSDPSEFVVGAPTMIAPQVASLRITELMYNPDADSDFEFLELENVGDETIDLSGVRFTDGLDFDFVDGDVDTLGPGERVVLVNDRVVFATRYDTTDMLIAGEYGGRLSDSGERIELTYGRGETILAFEYDDLWLPLTDGFGLSLVIDNPLAPAETWGNPESWRSSKRFWGTPGTDDAEGPEGGFQRHGDLDQNGSRNVSDAVAILRFLVGGEAIELPCGDGSLDDASNRTLLDLNSDGQHDITDGIHLLTFLFRGGAPPALGANCVHLEACPDACGG